MKKKYLFSVRALIIISLTLAMAGCSGSSQKNEPNNGLVGTTWKGAIIGYDDLPIEYTLLFQESTFTMIQKYTDDSGNTYSGSTTGTYVYNYPSVILTIIWDDGTVHPLQATISGNNMTLYDEEGNSFILAKQ